MTDLEKANQKQEAWEELNQEIEDAVRGFYHLMGANKTDYQRLDPDIELLVIGRG